MTDGDGTRAPGVGSSAQATDLNIYYEIHGEGAPLVVLHGGIGAGEMFETNVPELAKTRQVIVVHLQAHGHTPDTDRPLHHELMADDVAAVIAHLGFLQADVLGYSMGAGVALQAAIRHPEVVGKLVVVSVPMRHNGWYPEVLAGFEQMVVDAPKIAEGVQQSPLNELYPGKDWQTLVTKVAEMGSRTYDWSDDVAAITSQAMLVFADADAVRPEHIVEFYKSLGGGEGDAGPDGSLRPAARLAILPGSTHYDILSHPALAPAVTSFLETPMPAAPAGRRDV